MSTRYYPVGRLSSYALVVAAIIAPMLAGCSSFSANAPSSTAASSRQAFDPFNFSFDRPQSPPERTAAMQIPAQPAALPPSPPSVSPSAPVAAASAGAPPPLDLEVAASADSPTLQQSLGGDEAWCSLPTEACDSTHRVQN